MFFIYKENGNNIEYMSTLCSVLLFIFPLTHKWKHSTISLNIDLSIACLNLLHTVLNANPSSSSFNSLTAFDINSGLMGSFKRHSNPKFDFEFSTIFLMIKSMTIDFCYDENTLPISLKLAHYYYYYNLHFTNNFPKKKT